MMFLIKLARIVSPLTTILFVIGWTMVAVDGEGSSFDMIVDIPALGIPTGLAIQAVAILLAGIAGTRSTEGGMGLFIALNGIMVCFLAVFIIAPVLLANIVLAAEQPLILALNVVTLVVMFVISVRGLEDIYRIFVPKRLPGML